MTDSSLKEPNKEKLELFVLIHSEGVLTRIEAACAKEFDRLRNEYKDQIRKLSSSKRLFYSTIAPKPKLAEDCKYPESFQVRGTPPHGKEYKHAPFATDHHLYVNSAGKM